jgi:creatinine amidohydrolase
MPGIELQDLTSAEAARLVEGSRVVGLIGLGAVEQHGPHLPLATDAIIAKHLSDAVADRLAAPVLVAPVLPGGLSTHHLGFAGTVDLAPTVVGGFVDALLSTMAELGVADVALFSAHGGNFGLLGEIVERYASHPSLRVIAYTDIARYLDVMMRAAATEGLEAVSCDAHAGALETSQILHILGADRISVPDGLEGYVAAEPGWYERLGADGMKALSPNGVLGRPADATAAAGAAICAALAEELAGWIARSFELQ